jgi:hypothetical protein
VYEKYPLDLATKEKVVMFARLYEQARRFDEGESLLLHAQSVGLVNVTDLG